MAKTNNGNVFSHVRRAVFVSVGSCRSGLRDMSGPECSPGGGISGRIVWAAEDWDLKNGDAVKVRSNLLYCCGRRNGCRLDIDDDENALRDGASIRLRGFITGF